MKFVPDNYYNQSHKMGNASISYDKAIAEFGEGETESGDGKVANSWQGEFTSEDGTTHRASFWNWKGGLNAGFGVSVWISDVNYLAEFIKFIEA